MQKCVLVSLPPYSTALCTFCALIRAEWNAPAVNDAFTSVGNSEHADMYDEHIQQALSTAH